MAQSSSLRQFNARCIIPTFRSTLSTRSTRPVRILRPQLAQVQRSAIKAAVYGHTIPVSGTWDEAGRVRVRYILLL